jgi:hypothetical protein
MSSTRFRTAGIELELQGSEDFVLRQLRDLAFALGDVDPSALLGSTAAHTPSASERSETTDTRPTSDGTPDNTAANGGTPSHGSGAASARVETDRPANGVERMSAISASANRTAADRVTPPVRAAEPEAVGRGSAPDTLVSFFESVPAIDRDRQAHAALVFAYHLQREEGLSEVRIGDLLKCCIRVGVDSRNFHRAIGVLTRRSLLAEVRRGSSYRITDQGMAAIEERLS